MIIIKSINMIYCNNSVLYLEAFKDFPILFQKDVIEML